MKKLALLVGLKSVNPSAYGGWDGTNGCWGCELDVDHITDVLEPLGYAINTLKTEDATAENILNGIRKAAAALESGDIFVFYYSGHGGQQYDVDEDELDGHDETLVAYNRELVDDELNTIWPNFSEGVRIVMMSDSCNSGSNYRLTESNITNSSPMVLMDVERAREMQAQMIHFGGCRDGYSSSGYFGGGAFTTALCTIWDKGQWDGNYREFLDAIAVAVRETQEPQYNEYGAVEDRFRNSKPFVSDVYRVRCVLDIDLIDGDLMRARRILVDDGIACLLNGFDVCQSQLSASRAQGHVNCHADSHGNWGCSGGVTFEL